MGAILFVRRARRIAAGGRSYTCLPRDRAPQPRGGDFHQTAARSPDEVRDAQCIPGLRPGYGDYLDARARLLRDDGARKRSPGSYE